MPCARICEITKMIQYIPVEITIGSFSIIGVLTGYIWNNQAKKIRENKDKLEKLPCNVICSQISAIHVDIKWIKEEIRRQNK